MQLREDDFSFTVTMYWTKKTKCYVYHFIGSVARSTLHLPGISSQLIATSSTVEVIRMESVPTPPQWFTINGCTASLD